MCSSADVLFFTALISRGGFPLSSACLLACLLPGSAETEPAATPTRQHPPPPLSGVPLPVPVRGQAYAAFRAPEPERR
jgi:hypothetical protein